MQRLGTFALYCADLLPPSMRLLRIGSGVRAEHYLVKAVASDFGRAFAVAKVGGKQPLAEPYLVLLDGPRSSCECLGYLRHNKCKHLEALRAVRRRLPCGTGKQS